MERVAPTELAETILAAPAWAKVGITAPNPRLREEAAIELARTILGNDPQFDPRQLALTL